MRSTRSPVRSLVSAVTLLLATAAGAIGFVGCSTPANDASESVASVPAAGTDGSEEGDAPSELWEMYAGAYSLASQTFYADIEQLVSRAPTIAVGRFVEAERGRRLEFGEGLPSLEFVNLTLEADTGERLAVELPLLPVATPEVAELRAKMIDQEAANAAVTDEEVLAAVDVAGLEAGLAELYESVMEQSVDYVQHSLPPGRHLVFLVESSTLGGPAGVYQIANSMGLVREIDAKVTMPLIEGVAEGAASELLEYSTVDALLQDLSREWTVIGTAAN